ncbi:hypothetical protein KQI84_00570 [bacterium]|nr:hypothetical protein [bacterium]
MKSLADVATRELEFAIDEVDSRIVEVRAGEDRIGEMIWHDAAGAFVEVRSSRNSWGFRTSEAAVEIREVGCDCLVGMLDRATKEASVAAARPLTWLPNEDRFVFSDGDEALQIEGTSIRTSSRLCEHPDGTLLVMLAVHLKAIEG